MPHLTSEAVDLAFATKEFRTQAMAFRVLCTMLTASALSASHGPGDCVSEGPDGFLGNPQCGGCDSKRYPGEKQYAVAAVAGASGKFCTKPCKTHTDCEVPNSPSVPISCDGKIHGLARCALTDGKSDYCAFVVRGQSDAPCPAGNAYRGPSSWNFTHTQDPHEGIVTYTNTEGATIDVKLWYKEGSASSIAV